MRRALVPVVTVLAFALGAYAPVGCKGGASTGSPADAGPDLDAPCAVLFGNPNDKTGLDASQCQPVCTCGGQDFVAPAYDAGFIQSLITEWQIATPYAPLTADPYDAGAPAPSAPGTVCAVLPQAPFDTIPHRYTLVTYSSEAAAVAAGAKVTHFDACGVCSTLADLAVYMANDDLTAPVRNCGFDPSTEVSCLQQLGFDLPCAQIWAYNIDNTRSACFDLCAPLLNAPYNTPDGGLNACLQCDEDQSGPVFKAVAGRTRRNTGIPNALCRPCSQVQPLVHAY
jgi:hypothetical protein